MSIKKAMGVVVGLMSMVVCVSCRGVDDPRTVMAYIFPDGSEQISQVAKECSRLSQGRYRIALTILPRSANDQRLQLARRLAGGDSSVDIMALDTVWTAEFAQAGWLVPVDQASFEWLSAHTLPGPLGSSSWQGQFYGYPLWANTQVLWYRKDIVNTYLHGRLPRTWEDLVRASTVLHAAGQPSWLEVQGRQYEGLLVWFNSLLASAGGAVLDDDATHSAIADSVSHERATREALRIISLVAHFPGQDPSIAQSDESHSRLSMENGSAAFEINWPFAFASMRDNAIAGSVPFLSQLKGAQVRNFSDLDSVNHIIRQKFDFAPYPSIHGVSLPTLGGVNLGISATSHKQVLAREAAQCLSNEAAQKVYSIQGGTPPTLTNVYQDPQVRRVFPDWKLIYQQLSVASQRPKSTAYQAISTLITEKLSPITGPAPSAEDIDSVVRKALSGRGLVP